MELVMCDLKPHEVLHTFHRCQVWSLNPDACARLHVFELVLDLALPLLHHRDARRHPIVNEHGHIEITG